MTIRLSKVERQQHAALAQTLADLNARASAHRELWARFAAEPWSLPPKSADELEARADKLERFLAISRASRVVLRRLCGVTPHGERVLLDTHHRLLSQTARELDMVGHRLRLLRRIEDKPANERALLLAQIFGGLSAVAGDLRIGLLQLIQKGQAGFELA